MCALRRTLRSFSRLVLLGCFVEWNANGCTAVVLWGAASIICLFKTISWPNREPCRVSPDCHMTSFASVFCFSLALLYFLPVFKKLVWLGWVGFYGNAKSFLYIYFKYIWFGLVWWHINHCRLFYTKSFLYIYIKYIWFGRVRFYGISTIVDYLMPNPLYTYILNI